MINFFSELIKKMKWFGVLKKQKRHYWGNENSIGDTVGLVWLVDVDVDLPIPTGKELDVIGKNYGIERLNGEDCESYRKRIVNKHAEINASCQNRR